MLYAEEGGARRPARPGRVGVCPLCGGEVIAKCGQLRVWHWAHRSLADCDTWSEPVGPWHLSWQRIVQPRFLEVTVGPHRADIRTHDGLVIELQHSPIKPQEIAERERFYGDMLWVFDATHRFWSVRSGEWIFFSLGRVRHLETCRRPLLLDFGGQLVEVTSLGETQCGFSGFGRLRDRRSFVAEYLAQSRRPGPLPPVVRSGDAPRSLWPGGRPWRRTEHVSRWIDPRRGATVTYPRRTLYIPLDFAASSPKDRRRATWLDAIFSQRELCAGWRSDELRQMCEFLGGTPMILDGRLRLMPHRAARIVVRQTVRTVKSLLAQVDVHIQAGRIPLLKENTRRLLLDRAAEFEIAAFGARLGFPEFRRGRPNR